MSLQLIDEGYDFVVAIVDGWIFRVPRRPVVAEALRHEVGLLPVLAAALPVEVPRFELVSTEPRFVAYRRIERRPMRDEDPDGALRVSARAAQHRPRPQVVSLTGFDPVIVLPTTPGS